MGAVSPAARSSPRITPVMMPGSALGSTTLRMVCHFVPPRLMLTVRKLCGTDRSASSAVLMITGSVMIASVSDPARIDDPMPSASTNSPSPNRPYTIDGTPARLMIARRIMRVNLLSRAYSLR